MEKPKRRRSEQVIGFVWRLAVPLLWLAGWLAVGLNVSFYLPTAEKSTKTVWQVLASLMALADRLMILFMLAALGAMVGILLLANAIRSFITNPPGFYNWFWVALVGIPLTAAFQAYVGIWSLWPATALFLEIGVAVALILPGMVAWIIARRTAVKE